MAGPSQAPFGSVLSLRDFTQHPAPSERGKPGCCCPRPRRESCLPGAARNDIHKILLIGSGRLSSAKPANSTIPARQACKALREEGYEVVLVNSNPATIMTDPEMADRTYIKPGLGNHREGGQTERPDALLPTLGGPTSLNWRWTFTGTACWRNTASR